MKCSYLKILSIIFIIFIFISSSLIINFSGIKNKDITKPSTKKWYDCIKSDITPSSIVFTVVWSILYILLGIVLGEILCINYNHTKYYIILLYIINLLLNIIWCYLFFIKKDVFLSKIVMGVILSTSIIISYILFKFNIKLKYKIMYIIYTLWIFYAYIQNILSSYKELKCRNLK